MVNTQTSASVRVTVTGFTANKAPHNITFTGTMACAVQGDFPVSVVVPQNGYIGQLLIADQLWKNDDCTVTLQVPGHPTGYTFKPWTKGSSETKTAINSPALFTFVIPVVFSAEAPDLPLTGGVSADSVYLGGAGILLLGILVSVAVERLRGRLI